MRDPDELFAALARSKFRSRFRLGAKETSYLNEKTLAVVLEHGRRFIIERLADAQPKNDGKQTPMRGHPVFVAQHATATCCRGCLPTCVSIIATAARDETVSRRAIECMAFGLRRVLGYANAEEKCASIVEEPGAVVSSCFRRRASERWLLAVGV